ncbi:MAG TPA: TIGR03118 family protein [Candidatus Sulfotelmatobacter sp.]|nr:TIGR03118 family protein [Candidatus Sulfotelmatobacter sp.]
MPRFFRTSRFRALLVPAFTLLATAAFAQHYQRTNLVADSKTISFTATVDPNLVNAWGLSRGTGSPFWVSDNGTGLTTLYDSTGSIVPLVVTIPAPPGANGPSAPTGTVFNFTTAFNVIAGQPAIFMFATEDGTIAGWNPNVNVTKALLKLDHSKAGAIFKGLAIAMTSSGPRLYTTNFATGKVEVYDGNFIRVPSSGFVDSSLPADFVPFGIQNVGGNIVVTFAHRLPGSRDEDHGPGLGYVDVFDNQGQLLVRLQHGSFLNAPWGIAMAPSDFGPFSHRLLIGNFGDGRIHAFNALSGKLEGTILNMNGNPVVIEGLWALSFGSDAGRSGLATELFFTAGPNDESDGLFGKLTASASEQRGNSE